MLKAYKTEIKPTKEQQEKIKQSIGVCRWLYNEYIGKNRLLYKMYQRGLLDDKQKHFISANEFDKYINNKVKVLEQYSWINNCGSKARKKSIVQAETAFKRFFKGLANFPRFKKKSQEDVSIYFPKNNATDWCIWRHKIMIPTLKQVQLKEYGYIPVNAKVKSGTVSYKAGRFYVSVIVEIDESSHLNKDLKLQYASFGDGIGLDLGIKNTVTLSNGTIYENINKTDKIKRLEKKLKRRQRRLSRKFEFKKKDKKERNATDFSANIEKEKLLIKKIYWRLNNIRTDYENKTVHSIIQQKPRWITMEDLNVRGMMKNRHLAKAIGQQRFYSLKQKLICKAHIADIEMRIADRFYPSSKRCHNCGNIKHNLKLTDRTYICEICGYSSDRDINAALNLYDAVNYIVV